MSKVKKFGKKIGKNVGKGFAIGAATLMILVAVASAVSVGVLIWFLATAYPIGISVSGTPGSWAYTVELSKRVSRPATLEIRELEGEKRVLTSVNVQPDSGTSFTIRSTETPSKQMAVLTETESGKILGKSPAYRTI